MTGCSTSIENVSSYPIRQYRRIRDVLDAERTERVLRCLYDIRLVETCGRCNHRLVTNIITEENRPMSQLPSSKVAEPFGEVNVFTEPDGRLRIRATILSVPSVGGARTGLAIDGSISMRPVFGAAGTVSSLFAPFAPNLVQPVVRTLGSYLASFDSDGKTDVIYWACGPTGVNVEEIGELDQASLMSRNIPPPRQFGTGTKLLPAMRFFLEQKYPDSPWSLFVFLTNGVLEDLPDVQAYTLRVAKQIAAGQKEFVKLVLIGVGANVDERQMEALDDLDYGGLKDARGDDIDLWDHKMVSEMKRVEEIFAEAVSSRTIIAPSAEIMDDQGRPAIPLHGKSYKNGLPALLEFVLSADAKSFTLQLPQGKRVSQPLY